jgi:signal transduction histidine kinase
MGDDGGRLEQLGAELELRRRQLDAVRTITAAVYSTTDLAELIGIALDVCLEVVQCEAGSILLHEPVSDTLEFAHVVGPKSAELTGASMPATEGIAGRVFRTSQLDISDNVQADPAHYRKVGEDLDYVTRSMVTVPLKQADGETIGVMQVLNRTTGPFTPADLEVLTIVANQAAMAIDNAQLHAEARLGEIVKLIGDIAHDVKNFLTPVDSGVKTLEMLHEGAMDDLGRLLAERCTGDLSGLADEVLESLGTLNEFFPEVVEMVLQGCSNVTARAREIADCIKGEVAKPSFEMLDASDVIRSVGKVLRVVAERAGVHLDLSGVSDLPPVPIDRKLLHSAVYNLVNNAVPETPPGGTITVSTSTGPEGAWPEGSYIQIVVRDTGRGMPEEIRRKLFTKDAQSTKPGGTGLGTRIVRNAIDAHGGTIAVESCLGLGSCFTIRIPSQGSAR